MKSCWREFAEDNENVYFHVSSGQIRHRELSFFDEILFFSAMPCQSRVGCESHVHGLIIPTEEIISHQTLIDADFGGSVCCAAEVGKIALSPNALSDEEVSGLILGDCVPSDEEILWDLHRALGLIARRAGYTAFRTYDGTGSVLVVPVADTLDRLVYLGIMDAEPT